MVISLNDKETDLIIDGLLTLAVMTERHFREFSNLPNVSANFAEVTHGANHLLEKIKAFQDHEKHMRGQPSLMREYDLRDVEMKLDAGIGQLDLGTGQKEAPK